MAHAPLVITDEVDSQTWSSDAWPDFANRPATQAHLDSFQYVHCFGLPHRATHIEIMNGNEKLFVWERKDGRLEIPGGHVDWVTTQNRPESYEEAAMRETVEELQLDKMWESKEKALNQLQGLFVPVARMINQIPSSHVNNNEWVTVYRLHWREDWQDPVSLLQKSNTAAEGKPKTAQWTSLQGIKTWSLDNPMKINAALRLFLQRQGVIISILLNEYVERFPEYRRKICPNLDQ
jgi:8-oxo-dGTP pyrophosphatase MutT (NUDIX family)